MRFPRAIPLMMIGALLALSACDDVTVPSTSSSAPPGANNGGNTGGNAKASLTQLSNLKVAPERAMTGYSREKFPHWNSAGKNCDVRDTVLARDGKDITLDGCNVTGGTWFSVYDDKTFTEPLKIDIDHMVPLANAWRSGADEWTNDKRSAFANDLERPQLFAVSATSNRSKGDQNPAQWKPPSKSFYCTYSQQWITVKSYWQLTITEAEKASLTEMLGTCA